MLTIIDFYSNVCENIASKMYVTYCTLKMQKVGSCLWTIEEILSLNETIISQNNIYGSPRCRSHTRCFYRIKRTACKMLLWTINHGIVKFLFNTTQRRQRIIEVRLPSANIKHQFVIFLHAIKI